MDLTSGISSVKSIGPVYLRRLEKLGITTVSDLLNHIPFRYQDYSNLTTTLKCEVGETVTIKGEMVSLKNVYTRRGLRMQIGSFKDEYGKLPVVWFNQPFLIKMLYPGQKVALAGEVKLFSGKKALVSPDYEILNDEDTETKHTGKLVAIYPETSGLSSKWLRSKIKILLDNLNLDKEEFLPKKVLTKYKLTGLSSSYFEVHAPKSLKKVEEGRKRLAFNELLFLQLTSLGRKLNWKNRKSKALKVDKKLTDGFIGTLPFDLTSSQKTAITEILSDLKNNQPMNRLLEGDVGSGKTVVAAIAAFTAFVNGYQSIFMAPTQILAAQHFETLKSLLTKYKVRISLITSEIKKEELGRADIIVGTHALLHKKNLFDKVALVVIDEQHRFGVAQRQLLVKKTGTPHVLTMTATPIPRTIALTIYGDLDLSVLTEMPLGRKKIVTWIVPPQKRDKAYKWIENEIEDNKTQVFVICPLIEQSMIETMQEVKAVKVEFEKLKKVFKKQKLGLLHGRMKAKEKDKVLGDFRKGKTNILVSTPVVEVGIDIPNATVMVIEGSERFGLAQLHQLRGRVGRSDMKSYCLLFSEHGQTRRLTAMTKTNSGFELAELDLKIRGPGEIFGTKQSGFPELKVASWSDAELIKETKELALGITSNPKAFPKVIDKAKLLV